jgi:hypothetical protein
MVEFAHFTSTELPGTLAIWIAGIGLGLALATRAPRAVTAALALIAALAGIGMLGDAAGWSEAVRIGIDAAFLLAGAALALALLRGRAGERTLPGPSTR